MHRMVSLFCVAWCLSGSNAFGQSELEIARASVVELRGFVSALATQVQDLKAAGLPPGAVVAMDQKQGCPAGWQHFGDAMGRTIIGADQLESVSGASARNLDESGSPLSARAFRSIGGTEKHTLKEDEMPPHDHTITLPVKWGTKGVVPYGWSASDAYFPDPPKATVTTSITGSGKAHNNMQPFIALTYCRKN